MVDTIVSHGIIKSSLFIDTDIPHGHKIMGACFVDMNTTIGFAAMVHFTNEAGVKNMRMLIDLRSM